MAEPAEIMAVLECALVRASDLSDRKIMVTAGPTREHLDPVRFISNPSTGRMGYIIADRAARRGADVVLISGPTELLCPPGVKRVLVESTAEMRAAVLDCIAGIEFLVMAAAPADFRPVKAADSKIKKSAGIPRVELEPTEDILKAVKESGADCMVVGFAAETHDVVENARLKLAGKGMTMIVANLVAEPGSGFGARTNQAAIIESADDEAQLRMTTKVELADDILDRISALNA